MSEYGLAKEIEIGCWTDFESEIQDLHRVQGQLDALGRKRRNDLLFRGAGNSEWDLETTLERSYPLERSDRTMSLRKYYWRIFGAKHAIATLTGKSWEIPNPVEFEDLLRQDNTTRLNHILNSHHAIYEYLVYVRHHGFPSPLLDWTASPYVAAFFAFDSAKDVEHVCMHALLLQDQEGHSASSNHHLFFIGQYVESHRRHYAQQSRYSMCVRYLSDGDERDYEFCRHDAGMPDAVGPNGNRLKIKIPAKERTAALKHLDLMNINPYTIYGSEDSLIRAIARRQCLFQDWDV